jgi:hypothetical protein
MRLNTSPTELTTGATDALLGLLCLGLAWWLSGARPSSQRSVWLAVFVLMAVASGLGAAAHGLLLSDRVSRLLWQPLYLSLGLTIALFVVGAIHDSRGAAAAHALLPWAIATGIGFYLLTNIFGGGFFLFIVYEAVAMIAALAIYVGLSSHGMPGAGTIAAGIAVSIVAAVVQATRLELHVVVPFDHNGLFHLVQMGGAGLLAAGLHRSL